MARAAAKAATRRIVTSFDGGRLQVAAAFVQGAAAGSEVLILAGARGAADDLARECARGGGLLGVHRLTLTQLAAVLATESGARQRLAPISALGMEALAARAAFECRARGALEYFAPVADTPGFARALASTLSELRREGVDRDQLAKAGAAGADLARLLGVWERELAERSLSDRAMLYRLAAEAAAPPAQHRLLGLPLLLLDCRLDTAVERELAAAVARRAPGVLATAVAADPDGIQRLEEILGAKAEGPTDSESRSALDRARRCLFSLDIPAAAETDDTVEIFSAPGEGMECVEIARRIRRLAESGTPFDRVAILLRNPGSYQPMVEEALRRAGIPGYFTRGTARPDAAGRAFLALLACAGEGLSAARFAEYLSLGQTPRVEADGTPPRREADWTPPENDEAPALRTAEQEAEPVEPEDDPASPVVAGQLRVPFSWEKLLVEASVIGGRDRWQRRLRGLDAEFEMQLAEMKEGDEPRRAGVERQRERLGNLQRFAQPVVEFLDELPRSAAWGEWLPKLRALAAMTLRRPEPVLAALAELEPMEAVGPAGLDEVRSALSETLRSLRRAPPERRYGSVFVGTIEESRGRSFAAVFLPGLAEGSFPRKAPEDPLLLDERRETLGGGLRRRSDRLAEERLLLRTAAAAAESRWIVSYPRMDVAQTRSRVPSFYFWEVVRAAEGRLPELRELERRAARAAPARLGWPAPRDPQAAIDAAEYDLAVLDPWLREARGGEAARGRARYLLGGNAHLARSLRTRGRRWKNFWSEADGIVDPDAAAREVLERHRLPARAYSPTALEQFAACPYRFLLHAIHHFRQRQEAAPLERLDPLTRGSLFHAVQFELLRNLQTAKRLPVTAENLNGALQAADEALDGVAAAYEERLAPAIARIWQSEVEEVRADLRGWVRQLVEVHAEWMPERFEFSFGLARGAPRDPTSSPAEAIVAGGVQLRGSIDLIERHRRSGRLRVTDHKTGKAPTDWPLLVRGVAQSPVVVGGGRVLQPLLYGLAAEALLGEAVESGMLFYCTQRGAYSNMEIPFTDETRQAAARVLETIDRSIEDGFLAAAPQPGACARCDYRIVCGPYEEMRTARKQKAKLAGIEKLRVMD